MHLTRPLLASILAVLSSTAVAGQIDAQPLGLLDKKGATGNLDQSDFFAIRGPLVGNSSTKLVFSALTKTGKTTQTRTLFVQNLGTSDTFAIDKNAPLKSIGTFTTAIGEQFDTFIPTGTAGSSAKVHYPKMYFHMPGLGLYVTEGGKASAKIRAESAKDPDTNVIGTAIRLSDFLFDEFDATSQARIFFGAKDVKAGVEPFISAGTAATTKVLGDLVTGKDTAKKPLGSFPSRFVAFGPQNDTQKVFFTALSSADGDTYQLWQIAPPAIDSKGKPIYTAALFTTGADALPGQPQNTVANGSDLFFTSGGTLYHLPGATTVSAADLEYFPATDTAQLLTFINESSSYSDLAFTNLDAGVRRYARWGHSSDSVVTLGAGANIQDPSLIIPADDNFYFVAQHGASTTTYLEKHRLADNTISDISVQDGANTAGVTNISEVCLVSQTLYFVGDTTVNGTPTASVLCRMNNDHNGNDNTVAEVVPSSAGGVIVGAKHLRAVVDASLDSGVFRLYFSAPVNSAQNFNFMPQGSLITDYGTKPFVTQAP